MKNHFYCFNITAFFFVHLVLIIIYLNKQDFRQFEKHQVVNYLLKNDNSFAKTVTFNVFGLPYNIYSFQNITFQLNLIKNK